MFWDEKGLRGGSEKASGVFPALSGCEGLKGTCDLLTACGGDAGVRAEPSSQELNSVVFTACSWEAFGCTCMPMSDRPSVSYIILLIIKSSVQTYT